MTKATTFSDALKAGKKPKRERERLNSPDRGSRFVETGEGLEIIRASDTTRESTKQAAAGEPVVKMVPIEDLLLDILEEEEAKAAKAKKQQQH